MSAQHLTTASVQPPPPPIATAEFVRAAVIDHIRSYKLWGDTPPEQSAEDICQHWHLGINGYALAKALDDYRGWYIGPEEVEELDGIDSAISLALRKARKAWATEWNIQPPFPVGTRVATQRFCGVIDHISKHDGATYAIKQDGCTTTGRFVLVKFEDVTAIETAAAA